MKGGHTASSSQRAWTTGGCNARDHLTGMARSTLHGCMHESPVCRTAASAPAGQTSARRGYSRRCRCPSWRLWAPARSLH